RGMSALAATLRQGLAYGLRDDLRQLTDEAVNGRLQATDGRLQATDGRLQTIDCGLQHVDLAFNPVEPGLDGSEVVAVAPGQIWRGMSALAATLRQGLAYGLRDDLRQLTDEAVNGRLQATDGRLQATDGRLQTIDCGLQHVDLAFNPVEPGLDGSEVVAVAPG